jgi:hypothetical protein
MLPAIMRAAARAAGIIMLYPVLLRMPDSFGVVGWTGVVV